MSSRSRRLSRTGRPVMLAVILSCILAAVGFGLINTLPTAASADRVAARLLASLTRVRATAADIHVGDSLRATCTRTYGHETVDSGKLHILLSGSRIDSWLGGAPTASRQLISAVSDLALCPGVLAADLASRIQAGPLQAVRHTRWHGRPAIRLRLSSARPVFFLYVTPTQLRPIGAIFISRRIHGWSLARIKQRDSLIEHHSFVASSRHSPCHETSTGRLSYPWPIKPFRRQHPVRGFFGDPRTIGSERLGTDEPGSSGSFTFHNGVDISAPGGTPVYPVVSGRAHLKSGDEVSVTTADGRTFQYFHITPVASPGEPVVASRTVLGYVKPVFQHVHLTEIDGFRAHNPLDPGHLEPYRDQTVPTIQQVTFTGANDRTLDPQNVHGNVSIAADASDTTPLPVPGHWFGFPITPALVTWRLTSPTGTLADHRVAADFRHREPPPRDFWTVYAAGTYQNFPDFARHFYWHVPGRYNFNLTPRPLNTRQLPNGIYRLTVLAGDTCDNHTTLTEQIRINNKRATVGPGTVRRIASAPGP